MRQPTRPDRTIAQELAWGARKLARAGRSNPQNLALSTWAVLARQKPGNVWLQRLSPPSSQELVTAYRRAVGEQVAGAPFQIASGIAAFRMFELTVDRDVLIPRVETESLVDHVLSWGEANGWGTAADVGTGSGALAISLAAEGGFSRVIATDVSPQALAIAKANASAVNPRTPVEFRAGSWLAPFARGEVDVLVSNPPYLTSDEVHRLAPEVRDFEPHMAFDGGPDGLDPFRLLLRDGQGVVRPGGLVALEVDSRRAQDVQDLAVADGWMEPRIIADVFERPRFLLALRPR